MISVRKSTMMHASLVAKKKPDEKWNEKTVKTTGLRAEIARPWLKSRERSMTPTRIKGLKIKEFDSRALPGSPRNAVPDQPTSKLGSRPRRLP